jgi:hypothetical protein
MENLEAVLKCVRESNEAAVVCEAALARRSAVGGVAFVVTADRDLIGL